MGFGFIKFFIYICFINNLKTFMKNLDGMVNEIHNMDCIVGMDFLPDNSIDLVVTSPPYNVGITYDVYKDDMSMEAYYAWCKVWLKEIYRTLKDDGRIAINVPVEVNVQDRGGVVFLTSEYWQMMKEIGFQLLGIVDLEEESSHRPKNTAWGSWMSPSAPYIYNPKECIIIAYKKDFKKKEKGAPQWFYKEVEVEREDGTKRVRREYSEEDKKEFMELVFGRWKYMADTKSLTKATFSMDIPAKAIKILTYKDEIVMDPFSGSGTTCFAAKSLDRRYIGFELSENYTNISKERLQII
jgi:site-specific DNA-methyltransferase (adenine-specific)